MCLTVRTLRGHELTRETVVLSERFELKLLGFDPSDRSLKEKVFAWGVRNLVLS